MYGWAVDLYPICRSITGNGARQTLHYLSRLMPGLSIQEVPTGTQAFDWTVPDEWNISEAYLEDAEGNRILDFKKCNLHVMGYSEPVDAWLILDELKPHLYSLPELPDAIPYVTSYYSRRWGFCLSERIMQSLKPGKYHAVIKSTLEPGSLSYGELILPGREEGEVLLSTYICHPSMANNELSGIVVTTALAEWLSTIGHRYTYRIAFIPETIGSIVYLSRNLEQMKRNTVAGFVVTCVGDERAYSYLPSRLGGTLADRAIKLVLKHHAPDFITYSYLDRGSDERQYCAPGVDLPVASLMRSKYGAYPEYHTSLDDLTLISPQGLEGSFIALQQCLQLLEENYKYKTMTLCEPQLGKRGLYPSISTRSSHLQVRAMMDFIAYADGNHDLLEIADIIGIDGKTCIEIAQKLNTAGLLKRL